MGDGGTHEKMYYGSSPGARLRRKMFAAILRKYRHEMKLIKQSGLNMNKEKDTRAIDDMLHGKTH